ncbi:Uncharacterised protein [Vibrio cholerae]|nr:Uncharacterised protein [Vibrio cholerae]
MQHAFFAHLRDKISGRNHKIIIGKPSFCAAAAEPFHSIPRPTSPER